MTKQELLNNLFETEKPSKQEIMDNLFQEEKPKRSIVSSMVPALETLKNIGRVYPVGETMAHLGSMTYGLPAMGLAGLAGMPFGKSEEFMEKTGKALIYEPQTKKGKELTESTFYPFAKLEEYGTKAGDYVYEKTKSPELAATTKTAIQASPLLLMARNVRRTKNIESAKQVIENPETEFLQKEVAKRFIEKEKITKSDPSTFYSGLPIHRAPEIWTKTVGKLVWDMGVEKGIPKLLEKIPGGKSVNRAFIYDYRGDLPNTATYIKSMEAKNRFQSIGREYAIDLGKRLQDMPQDAQLRMGEFIRGELKELSGRELQLATEAKQILYDLGQQAVETGLLAEETFFKNAGKYMPRLYTSKQYQELLTKYGVKKPERLDLSRFQKREDIPKEIREQMGEILTPGYPVAKGIAQLTHDIELMRWFKGIAKNPDWAFIKGAKGEIPKGFQKLPSTKKLGPLSDAHVHPEIWADLNESIRVRSISEKNWRRALGAWKFGKVIISPKTHVRNTISNSLLAHLGGLPMYEQPVYLTKAIKAMRSKGEYWKQAKQEGLLDYTFTNAELRALFDQVEGQMKGIKAESIPEKLGIIGNVWDKAKIAGNKAAKLYEAEEQWFKMAKFIHNVERKKMKPLEAAKNAEKWLFNYGKITKFQEAYRSKWFGAPFATFTFKAIPRIAEAAVKYPWRFALPGAIIYQLEKAAMEMFQDNPDQFGAKKELRPEWMRKGTFLGIPNFARMPVSDEQGREYYLNLTYITPWGDIAESGGLTGIPGGIMPFSQPFLKAPIEQLTNYNWFWREPIVKETDIAGKSLKEKVQTQAKKRGMHLFQSLAPTPAMDIIKGQAALRGKPDYRGRERPKSVVAADVLGGFKMYPVDYAEQFVRQVAKTDPQKGVIARKIRSEINILARKKNAMKKKGKDTTRYDEQIEEKMNQLRGMTLETKKLIELYKRTK